MNTTQWADSPDKVSTPSTVEVIGAGYVGLVTAACLASMGHEVRCVDVDAARVERLSRGDVPIEEPDLKPLILQGLASGRLSFSTDVTGSAVGADVALIAVGTLDGTGRWTDAHVAAVVSQLLAAPSVPRAIVVRSTLRPGRMAGLNGLVERSGHDTVLLIHPEFTKEGSAVRDFLAPDRIVVGKPADAPDTVADPVLKLYATTDAPTLVVDHASAEMIKIGSNVFLATKITLANELAQYAKAVGADMASVREGMGLDPRIGPAFLRSGPGFGGSCFPSQVELLAAISDELDLGAEVIPAVERFNAAQPVRVALEAMSDRTGPQRIAILGLAFKAGTDDVRESPALKVIDALTNMSVRSLTAYDPAVRTLPDHPDVSIEASVAATVEGADSILVLTEWPEFRTIDWVSLADVVGQREIFDTRGIIDADAAVKAGFRVRSLERRTLLPAPAPVRSEPLVDSGVSGISHVGSIIERPPSRNPWMTSKALASSLESV